MGSQRRIGLVLHNHRQFKFITKVEEARGRGTHHQRQAGGNVGFTEAKVFALGHRHHHHPVAGQVVGQLNLYCGLAVAVGAHCRGKGSQWVKVAAHSNRRGGIATGDFGLGRRDGHFHSCWCSGTIRRRTQAACAPTGRIGRCGLHVGGQRCWVVEHNVAAPVIAVDPSRALAVKSRQRVAHLVVAQG